MHTWEVPAAAAKLLQSCPTLCNPMDCSPPVSLSMGFSRQEYWSGVPLPSAGRFLRYTKYGLRTRQTKMIGQRKPGSNSDYHEGATRSPSPPACVPTHTVFFFLLINTLLVSLFSIFVGILFWKPKGPGPCHWRTHPVDRIQCLLPWRDLNLWPGEIGFKLLWAKATWDQLKPWAQRVEGCERMNPFLPWHLLNSLQQNWLFKCPSALNWPFLRIGQPGESFQMWLSMVSKPQEAIYLFY